MTRLRVGLDARPALFGRTGFGRAARELYRALGRRDDLAVSGYGVAWQRPDPGLPSLPGVVSRRIPSRLVSASAVLGVGVETWLGEVDVFQHTDLVYAPVRRAPEVLLLHDVVFLDHPGWFAPGFAEGVMGRLGPAARRAAALVVPSRRTADAVLRHGLAEAPRVHVVPLGCDHVDPGPRPDDRPRLSRLFERAGAEPLGDGQLVVLVPGTREPRKNQAALVEAFVGRARQERAGDAPPSAPTARLLLVGPAGWGCRELERRLAQPELRDLGVAVAGAVDDDDMQAALRACDIVAYPSFAEGFGLPVAEALACGRAVLTGADTPMADHGGDAVVAVDPRDDPALSRALESLLNDPERRREAAAVGPAAVAGLTWDAAAEALAAIYHRVAGAR